MGNYRTPFLVIVSGLLLTACAGGSTETSTDPSVVENTDTVLVSDPFNENSSIEVLAKDLPIGETKTIKVPLGWSESVLSTSFGFDVLAYSDLSTWQTGVGEDGAELILPMNVSPSITVYRLPAEKPDGTRYNCLGTRAEDLIVPEDSVSFDPSCDIPHIPRSFDTTDSSGLPDEFLSMFAESLDKADSARSLFESFAEAEKFRYKRSLPTSDVTWQVEESRDGDFALFFVTFSDTPEFNYGGIAFTERDSDNVARSYNVLRLTNSSRPMYSLEDLRSSPEFTILQSFTDKPRESG